MGKAEFVRNRIAELRNNKGKSEYEMSLELGYNKNYLSNMNLKNGLPSLEALFEICEYFEISMEQFFKTEMKDPAIINKIYKRLPKFTEEQLDHLDFITGQMEEVNNKEEQ